MQKSGLAALRAIQQRSRLHYGMPSSCRFSPQVHKLLAGISLAGYNGRKSSEETNSMSIAIVNGTVIDGRGGEPQTGMTLLIEHERIALLDRSERVHVPREATVFDARGGSVLPGLIDTHVHFLMESPALGRYLVTPPSLRLLEAIPRMRATLEAGVTTVRDAGGTPAGLKLAVERGIVPGPRMQVAVSIITQTGGHGDGFYPCCIDLGLFAIQLTDIPRTVADGEDEMRRVVREVLRAGADWVKLATTGGVLSTADAPTSSQLTIAEIAVAVYEAAAQEKRCMAHAQGTMGIKNALLAGVASIEHGVYLDEELIDLMLQRDVYLVPTLVAPLAVVEFSQEHPDLLPPVMAAKAVSVIDAHQRSFRMAVEAGVKIAMGTDSGVGPHGANGRELQLMVEHGMTAMQAIEASTLNAAHLLHLDRELGTLEAGKLADVVVVEGDVLENIGLIADPAHVKLVLKAGQIVKRTWE
ncbi:MAG TPA: amidohydrolase family protein [Ktedonobacteraceae bacterium]